MEVQISEIDLVLEQTNVELVLDKTDAVCVEVGVPGPPGSAGPTGPQGPAGIGISTADIREDEQLVGAINGLNQTYLLPNSEKALYADPGLKIKVSLNGVRLHEGAANDFTVSESGGVGTGYDTITLVHIAPISGDLVTADYIIDPP